MRLVCQHFEVLEIIFRLQICMYFPVYGVQSFVSRFHLDRLCNNYIILCQPPCSWHHYLKLLSSIILKQVFSIALDAQNQIGKEQLLACIEYHVSQGNSEPYGKCFSICDILSESVSIAWVFSSLFLLHLFHVILC